MFAVLHEVNLFSVILFFIVICIFVISMLTASTNLHKLLVCCYLFDLLQFGPFLSSALMDRKQNNLCPYTSLVYYLNFPCFDFYIHNCFPNFSYLLFINLTVSSRDILFLNLISEINLIEYVFSLLVF